MTAVRGPRQVKRWAILRAARSVFGRLGFPGASIEAIAAEAAVSTRTIYNHFTDKEQLFATVLEASSAHLASAREELVERHLGGETVDLERALIDLAREWLTPSPAFEEHFALVRWIRAERDRLPAETFRQWREAGPLRARDALARRFATLSEEGGLDADDADTAARHFLALIASEAADDEGDVDRVSTTGVRAFLHGYAPRR